MLRDQIQFNWARKEVLGIVITIKNVSDITLTENTNKNLNIQHVSGKCHNRKNPPPVLNTFNKQFIKAMYLDNWPYIYNITKIDFLIKFWLLLLTSKV